MDLTAYVPLIIIAAIVITAAFGALRHLTRSSSRDEIEAARQASARLSRIDVQAQRADSDAELADSLLPSSAEAMILPLGEPMERGSATFEGSLADARAEIMKMSANDRHHVAIWTPGHIFSADELLAEAPHHEHDPLSPRA